MNPQSLVTQSTFKKIVGIIYLEPYSNFWWINNGLNMGIGKIRKTF